MNIDNIFKRLNVLEQVQLKKYIENEINLEISKRVHFMQEDNQKKLDDQWDKLTDWLSMAMREHRISRERVQDIYARTAELAKIYNDSDFETNIQPSKDFEIITKDEFRDMIAELIECNCKGCIKSNKECYCYKILKRHDVETPTGYKRNCKYGY